MRCKPSEDVCLAHSRPLIGERFCEENCKHGKRIQRNEPCAVRGPAVFVKSLRCLDCGAWLSLGPANDSGEHAAQVAAEVRAAELAARWRDPTDGDARFVFGDLDDEEIRGWSIAETNMQDHTDRWHAGYLARAIATHEEG